MEVLIYFSFVNMCHVEVMTSVFDLYHDGWDVYVVCASS
jgi:hypothetical protein